MNAIINERNPTIATISNFESRNACTPFRPEASHVYNLTSASNLSISEPSNDLFKYI